MKILYWTGLFWPHIGGVEVLSLELIPALQKMGHEFVVLTSQSNAGLSEKDNYKGIPILRLPFIKGLANHSLEEIKTIKQNIVDLKESFKPDLIHLNSIDASIFFHHLTEDPLNKIPTLFTVHALPPIEINKNTVLLNILNSAQWITAASQSMLTTVQKILTENHSRSSLIYYGLKMPNINPSTLKFKPLNLLCIGRLVDDKGFDIAINSFAEIIDQFPHARLKVAGDGPSKSKLEIMAKSLGISNSIDFIGWISPDKVPELINDSTIVIVPSRWEEPFGLVALQAAQMARPAIAARVGGLPEIVIHNKTGLLFEKNNSSDLTKQIMSLLKNPAAAEQMGEAARRKAVEEFGFSRFVNEYDKLYKNMLEFSFKNTDTITF